MSSLWVSPGFRKQYYAVAFPSFDSPRSPWYFLAGFFFFFFLFLQPEIWGFICSILLHTFHAVPASWSKWRENREEKKHQRFSFSETMTPLHRGKGSPTSELLGAYRLPWVGTWGNGEMKKHEVLPHSLWALADPFPALEARTRGLPGALADHTSAHSRLHTALHPAWESRGENRVKSWLVWWYFKFRSSSPALFLLSTSQNLQIAARCVWFRVHSMEETEWNVVSSAHDQKPLEKFPKSFFSLSG